MLALVLEAPALACGSNCYMCHFNIPKDKAHAPIKECEKCHKSHSDKYLSSCGEDCFECHNYQKVMGTSKAHRVIKKCVKCHERIKAGALPNYYNQLLGGGN